jgi:hypothetical protein
VFSWQLSDVPPLWAPRQHIQLMSSFLQSETSMVTSRLVPPSTRRAPVHLAQLSLQS